MKRQGRCIRFFRALIVVILFNGFVVAQTHASPLVWIWDTPYRLPTQIPVYLCSDTFATWLGQLPIAEVEWSLKNALEVWNLYGGSNFRYYYAGQRAGTTQGCSRQSWGANGALTIFGQQNASNAGGCTYGVTYNDPGPLIYRGKIGIDGACNTGGMPINWVMDYREPNGTNTDFTTVLLHELAHSLGFAHECGNRISVVSTGLVTAQRVLWPTDAYYLSYRRDCTNCNCVEPKPCDANCPLVAGYSRVGTRQIEHTRSTNNGLNWSTEGNLQEFTNTPVGVVFGNNVYALSWKTPAAGFEYISTILGDGAGYWSKAANISGTNSLTAPAIGYGAGTYLLEWQSTSSDERRIWYKTSTNGSTWSTTSYLDFRWLPGGTVVPYGTMWEPAVAYLPPKGYFITAFTQWRKDENYASRGEVAVCLNPNPATSVWRYCRGLGVYSNGAPSIACHPTENKCLIAWTDRMPAGGYGIVVSEASVNWDGTGDRFDFTSTPIQLGETSVANSAVSFGDTYWMLGWRGDNGSNTGCSSREVDGTFPTFTDKRYPETLLSSSPSVVFGPLWSEFAYYFSQR